MKKESKPKQIATVAEFIEWINELHEAKGTNRLMLYRGLSDSKRKVQASGYRRIAKDHPPSSSIFLGYVEKLIDQAGLQGFREGKRGKLSDLELLAELQHQGAATCLIDFSADPLVALWFACQSQSETIGSIIAMPTDSLDKFATVGYEDLQKPIKELLSGENLWKWQPAHQNNRIIAQRSMFVFGRGTIGEEYYTTAHIPPCAKKDIIKELQEKHGITERTLFSDLPGFAQANAHNKPYDYSAEDYFNLGVTFHQQGDAKKAAEYYNQAIKINPKHAGACCNRGVAKQALGNQHGAIADYDQAIKINPKLAEAYINRGVTKQALGDHHGAIADFDQAIKINPQYAEAYNNRSIAKQALGNLHDAIADYDKVIKINSQDAIAYNNRGLAKQALGDTQGAIKDYDNAININPQDAEAYNNRGLAKQALGDTQGAIKDYGNAINTNPQDAKAYYNRGLAYLAIEDWKQAKVDLDDAVKLGFNVASTFNKAVRIADLEKRYGIKIPPDIAALLQPPQAE